MPKPRKELLSLDATPYYHCVSRCVRRAFLCGQDSHSGKSFEHRRQWINDKILQLAQIFAIDVCAYAVMSNHYHITLYIDKAKAEHWSDRKVVEQWHLLFKGNQLSQRYLKGEALPLAERTVLTRFIREWRKRLMDISWFMRVLNESIARRANREDDCTGRFWEGRFSSQALLDEKALITAMAYVDLNPIRANMAENPESSDYTSIKQRIHSALNDEEQPDTLMPFAGYPRENMPHGLPFRLTDYLELVDWTGRILREDKRGAINHALPPILDRLQIDPKHWLYLSKHFESKFKGLVGSAFKLKQVCQQLGYKRTVNISAATEFF